MAGAGGSWKAGRFTPAADASTVSSGKQYLGSLDKQYGAGAGRIRLASEIRDARHQVRGLTGLLSDVESGRAPRSIKAGRVTSTLRSERRRLANLKALAGEVRR